MVSAFSDPRLASAAKAVVCGALKAGAVMEIPWNLRRLTLRLGTSGSVAWTAALQRLAIAAGVTSLNGWRFRGMRGALGPQGSCQSPWGHFPGLNPIAGSNGPAAGVKKPAGGTCGLWDPGLGAMRARHSTDQRLLIGSTSRRSAPVNSWRGRPILYSGSPIISFSWAIQPTVRASAKMAVNSDTGMPMARCTMPE